MRSPSSRVLINRVDIYLAQSGRDTDGGVQFPYPPSPTYQQVPCTAQAQGFAEVEDQGRITQLVEWKIIFGSYIGISPKDKITLMDPQGVMHTLFAEAQRDEAGRGAAFTIRATERI